MKKQKIILVFILIFAIIVALMPFVKATDDAPIVTSEESELNPIDVEGFGDEDAEELPTKEDEEEPEKTEKEEKPIIKDEEELEEKDKLPQTGVLEDTTLFAFIGVCAVSAVYAYIKVRNYKNI